MKLSFDELAKVPRFVYALSYFSLIPLFALLYSSLLSGQFYHSTVPHEYSVRDDERRIGIELEQRIRDTFLSNNPDGAVLGKGWNINPASFKVISLRTTGDEMSLSFMLDMELTNPAQPEHHIHTAPRIKSPVWEWSESASADSSMADEDVIVYRPLILENILHHRLSPEEATTVGRKLFPQRPPKIDLWGEVSGLDPEREQDQRITMPITSALNKRILDLAKGAEGDPSKLGGNFWRMFYLSAATITTLGYGDILPLTTVARIAVSVEAVCGIVLIGLFINTLSASKGNGS